MFPQNIWAGVVYRQMTLTTYESYVSYSLQYLLGNTVSFVKNIYYIFI